MLLAPQSSRASEATSSDKHACLAGFGSADGCVALVTGSSGFVGSRLVEMLLGRGAKTVIAFDITQPDKSLRKRFERVQAKTGGNIIVLHGKDGDLTSDVAVDGAFHVKGLDKIDIVFHIGALTGPFFPVKLYHEVNYEGTLRIIEGCIKHNVPKLVYSSSPSTRFTGSDIEGLREDEMQIPSSFIVPYAETKAKGEMAVHKACNEDNGLLTISVAPHQVYGPYDSLFLPKILETAGNDRLNIFGNGQNLISICHVDNYCHGLLCGADALYKKSPALAKYYVVHDGKPVNIWKLLNHAIVAMGFTDLESKIHLPKWLLYAVAYICSFVSLLTGIKFKLNPFVVRMMTIHRYFSIENATRDLAYEPIIPTDAGWSLTIEWFKTHWYPKWKREGTSTL